MTKNVYYITGATGWVGLTLIRLLIEKNEEVVALVLKKDRLVDEISKISKDITIVFGDITNIDDCERFLNTKSEKNTIQKVIHCAAIVSVAKKDNDLIYNVNYNGTKNLADTALKYKVDKFIYLSSTHAFDYTNNKNTIINESFSYINNTSHGYYAYSKGLSSQYVLDLNQKGLNCLVFHASAVVGPNDILCGYMTRMFKMILNNKMPAKVSGNYDLIDVRDVAIALFKGANTNINGKKYILSGNKISLPNLIDSIVMIGHKRKILLTCPLWVAFAAAPTCEFISTISHKSPLFTKNALIPIATKASFSNKELIKDIGVKPRPLSESLKDTINYLIKQ